MFHMNNNNSKQINIGPSLVVRTLTGDLINSTAGLARTNEAEDEFNCFTYQFILKK